jgi:transaldolase
MKNYKINYYKVKICIDGASLNKLSQFKKDKNISGFTYNPLLFHKLKINNYLKICSYIAKKVYPKEVSLEVTADTEIDMIRQAKILRDISDNIIVKIPIMFTNGKSTINVIKELNKLKIPYNITAVFEYAQIKPLIKFINLKQNIVSLFCGRIFDAGQDVNKIIKNFKKKKMRFRLLWASVRSSYDIVNSSRHNFDLITLDENTYIKAKKFIGLNLIKYSRFTVNEFFYQSKKSNYIF